MIILGNNITAARAVDTGQDKSLDQLLKKEVTDPGNP